MRHGFLFIDKPRGPSSHSVVADVRRILGESAIGHLGTLDPLATGLLVLAVGRKALKVIEFFSGLTKEYKAEVTLGKVSTTYDAEGLIEDTTLRAGWSPPVDASTLHTLLRERFLGKVEQVPPAFSAVSVGGTRAYRKARRGESVDIPSRMVDITRCDVLEYAFPRVSLCISCSAGTYIRTLAHDLGASLRCGGYLSALERTKVGEWSVRDACELKNVAWGRISPLKDVLSSFPRRDLTDDECTTLSQGRVIPGEIPPSSVLIGWHGELPVIILEHSKKHEGCIKAKKVL